MNNHDTTTKSSMNRKFQLFQKDGETLLREVNPYENSSWYMKEWQDFEQAALSSAKPLIGNLPVKDVYDESELKIVWQYNSPDTGWTMCPDNLIQFKAQRQYVVRESYEYIGVKQQYDEFITTNPSIGLVSTNISRVDYEHGIQHECNRIIGLIENEKVEPKTGPDRILNTILDHLLTKIKQS